MVMLKWLSVCLCMLLCLTFLRLPGRADAAIIEQRSVTVRSNVVSATTTHTFSFVLPTSASVGSLVLQYCDGNPLFDFPCLPPAGLDVTNAVLSNQTGNTGFSIDTVDSTANQLVLTRTAAITTPIPNTYVFDNVKNPSTPGNTVYIRMASYASPDGSGALIDKGGVAFAPQNEFNVNAFVPPFLQLCVGITVAPDCSSIVGDSLDLGVLSSNSANKGQSQYAVATNDLTGYNVFATGTTMTSGNNTISSMSLPTASLPGTSQFGINLRANLIPAVGQDPVGLGTGVPSANYNIPNRFIYNDGDNISSSPLPSNYNRMTVSYLVNVPKIQPPGIYSTTITYIAVVQF